MREPSGGDATRGAGGRPGIESRFNRSAMLAPGGDPMTSSPSLTDRDREVQERAGRFVEELIPWEVHAEEHGGEIPPEERARHEELAKELGLFSMNMPAELGGAGLTAFQQ